MRYELTLHYRGELKPNGDKEHKHELRRHFHQQLKQYMSHESRKELFDSVAEKLETCIGSFKFLPIISDDICMAAHLNIFMLNPNSRGSIITQGGDIDNRLKTLLDALKIPDSNALPKSCSPQSDENPFYCLLKDDILITGLTISTDQLLEPGIGKSEVDLTIKIVSEETESFSIATKD
jgi:hypothetical protein